MPGPKGLGAGFFNRIKDRVTKELGNMPTQGINEEVGLGDSSSDHMSPALWSRILDRAKNMLVDKLNGPHQPGQPSQTKKPESERLDVPTIRNRISQAGRLGVLLLVRYNGVIRHIEPYSFSTKTVKSKKKGGVGARREYFYGYCRLHDTIELYLLSKVEAIYITDDHYTARWPILV